MHSSRYARRLALAAVLAAALVGMPRAEAAPRKRTVVVVHPLKGLGVDDETVGRLEELVRQEMGKVPGIRLIDARPTAAALGGTPCAGQEACLTTLARRVKASVAVYGVVGGLGEVYSISLKAVALPRGEVTRRVEETVGGEREVLIDGMRRAAFRLLRPAMYVGSLEIQLPVEGAEVQVDGRTVGTTPLARPVEGLEPGRHALKIVKKGFSDFDRFVEVRFGRVTVVSVDLAGSEVSGVIYRESAPPLVGWEEEGAAGSVPLAALVETEAAAQPADPAAPPRGPRILRWVGYGLLGSGALALGVGIPFGFQAREDASSLETKWQTEPPTGTDAELWSSMRRSQAVANGLYVTGGLLAAAGAGLLAYDFFIAPAAGAPSVRFSPTGPGGPGLTLTVVH